MAANFDDDTAEKFSAELRLNETRDELRQLFDRDPEARTSAPGFFPRSRTMRFLTGNGSTALLALGAGGLMLLRPGFLKTALRVVPVNALIRMAAVRFMTRRG